MKRFLMACLLFGLPQFAMAQEDAGTMKIEPQDMPTLKRNTIEVQPLAMLLSAIPGVAAAGASFEGYVTNQWAGVVSGTYGDIDLSRKNFDRAADETSAPLARKGYGYQAGVGVRYYEDPIGGSTYGGANLDYAETNTTWGYEDNEIASRQYAVIPSLTVGYRWVWNNGVMARLGAGAGMPKVDSQTTSVKVANNDKAAEGQSKVDDILDQKVLAKVDLGVGYSF